MDPAPHLATVFLAGDVMTGRGVDQALPYPGDPALRESYIRDARQYVALAERAHGPVHAPVHPRALWGHGLDMLEARSPDLSLVNLETSITTHGDFWPGKEVHYRMHPRQVACLQAAGIHVCALANNHVLDFDRAGLLTTLETLHGAGIATAGAGRNLREAAQPARRDLPGGGRAWVSAVGSETSGIPPEWAAGPSRPGVLLVPDLSERTADRVAEGACDSKGPQDLAIVSIHWGSNWGYHVTAAQVAFAHRLIDRGVDVVHGHSSHHVRPIECHRGKLILYGCGDLITDYEGIGDHGPWRSDLGALYFATLSRRDGTLVQLRLVPTRMHRMRLTRATPADTAWLQQTLQRISEPFGMTFERDTNDIRLQPPEGARSQGA